MDPTETTKFVQKCMSKIMPTFVTIAKNHCESPVYNPKWEETGDLWASLKTLKTYVESLEIPGIENIQWINEKHSTPALFFDIEPSDPEETYTILFYSHIDKIPFGTGWEAKHNPENPVIIDGHFYGRGVANGGYSLFTIITAIRAIKAQIETHQAKHPRIVVWIESSKESGSIDLQKYLTNFVKSITTPNLIICLEGEVPNYTHFCCNTSMKGEVSFDTKVSVATRGIHAGKFGGLVPDSFMIMQNLISRFQIVNWESKTVTIPSLDVEWSEEEKNNISQAAKALGESYFDVIPLSDKTELIGATVEERLINNTLNTTFSVIGQTDLPDIDHASAIIRPYTNLRFMFRLHPRQEVNNAVDVIKGHLTEDVPYKAGVELTNFNIIQGLEIYPSEKVISAFDKINKDILEVEQGIYIGMSEPTTYLYIMKGVFQESEILVTGAAGANQSKTKTTDENIDLGYWLRFISGIALFVGNYEAYKK